MENLDLQQQELRKKSLLAILAIDDVKKINEFLPAAEYYEFFPLIDFYISELDKEISTYKEFIESTDDEDELQVYKEELEKVVYIRDQCRCRKLDAEMKNKELDGLSNSERRNVIFALRNNGTPYILNDAKSSGVPEEYYQDLIDGILSFENGLDFNNPKHVKRLVNDDTVTDVFELRTFKFRVYFKILSNDLVYVMLAKQKKSWNDKFDKESIRNRKKNVTDEFNILKELIKNDAKKQSLVIKHRQIKEDMIKYLETNRRGEK